MKPWRAAGTRLRRFDLPEGDMVRHAVRITVWGRWFVMLVAGFLLGYRPDTWYPEHVELAFLQAPLLVLNGVVHHGSGPTSPSPGAGCWSAASRTWR